MGVPLGSSGTCVLSGARADLVGGARLSRRRVRADAARGVFPRRRARGRGVLLLLRRLFQGQGLR